MMRSSIWRVVLAATCGNCACPYLCAQTELNPVREIHLPVSSSRGSYSHFPTLDMSSRQHFAMRVAPDQSLLAFDSDTSGKWPLLRLRDWWTDAPTNEVLNLPGWGAVDAMHIDSIHVDVQITPNGRYAVAFAGADWMQKSDFLLFAPRGYVARKPDTIVTVVDLLQWKIVSSFHTTGTSEGRLSGVRVVSNDWVALDFGLGASPGKSLIYRYSTKLLSLPEQGPGPECLSDRPFRGGPSLRGEVTESERRLNDEACQNVLHATGTASVDALEVLIDRGQNVPPQAVIQGSELEDTEDDYFRRWGEYNYLFYTENPPFESSSHRWYGIYSRIPGSFTLEIFDATGGDHKAKAIPSLLCSDALLVKHGSACGSRVIDFSENQHVLLAYSRTQRGDFDGMVRRTWLTVLPLNDLGVAKFIDISKFGETVEYLAHKESHSYIVVLEHGETLRVYAIPEWVRGN